MWPSEIQEQPAAGGFLPAMPSARSIHQPEKPRGPPTGRPSKARAVDMDEALSQTGQLKGKMENAERKQQLLAQKIKEGRSKHLSLKQQAGSMEAELEQARAEAERSRAPPEARLRLERLQGDHATLQATHAWTKSSLDSTLAAQEEYRRGYTSLQAAYKKTKGELEQKERLAEEAREARREAEQISAALPGREAEFRQDLEDAQDALRRMLGRQKAKSKKVLEKLLASSEGGLRQLAFAAWRKGLEELRFGRENARAIEASQRKLREYQDKKKGNAGRVLLRVSAANDSSLLSLCFQSWSRELQEARKERLEARKLQETLRTAKLSARRTLETHLNGSITGILTTALREWLGYVRECRKVSELRGQAERKLLEYKSRKKGEQTSVIERLAGERVRTLVLRMFTCWAMSCLNSASSDNAAEDLASHVRELEAQLKQLQEECSQAAEKLEDTNEEIEESRRKNERLREEFKSILRLQENMGCSFKELDI